MSVYNLLKLSNLNSPIDKINTVSTLLTSQTEKSLHDWYLIEWNEIIYNFFLLKLLHSEITTNKHTEL